MSKEVKLIPFVYTGKAHEASTMTDADIRLGIREAVARAGLYGLCGERLAHEKEIDDLTFEVRERARSLEKAHKDLEEGETV